MYKTPVLFIIFNRLRTTPKAFECIRQIKPQYLYIAADGPRPDKPGEAELCKQTRELVLNMIDWPCEVKTLFRDENWGCGKGVSDAITWFFNEAEEGIVLEDDCIPDPSFFTFCEVLLERYRDNPKIMHIGGNNFQFGQIRGDGDYYYSFFSHNWGWASWKRAWKHFQYDLDDQKNQIRKVYKPAFKNNKPFVWFLDNRFNEIKMPQNHIWDIQWHFAIIKNKGISIVPNKNLVQNIGFGEDGTHTLREEEWNTLNVANELRTFRQPSLLLMDRAADDFTIENNFKVNQHYQKEKEEKNNQIKERRRQSKRLFLNLIKSIMPNFFWLFLKKCTQNLKSREANYK
jgi:hypothetical protein